jgi:hypothetical protein
MIEQHALAPSVRAAVQAHYERALDLIAANFPLAPASRSTARVASRSTHSTADQPTSYRIPSPGSTSQTGVIRGGANDGVLVCFRCGPWSVAAQTDR